MPAIYLDYAATTPLDPRVLTKMLPFLTHDYGNPASLHAYGQTAKAAIECAREQVASLLQALPSEIIFTSGATESINLAIKGIAHLYKQRGKHMVTIKTEHKAVLDTCQHLEKENFPITYLSPLPSGLIDLEDLKQALRTDTILVSIMYVNNEIGVIQNLAEIANLTASRGILLHVDAAQAVGKIELDVRNIPIDLLSFCAHKVYGPKGIGALYLRKKPRVRVMPLIHGGGNEQGMRSGTLATHQIVGMGEAFALAQQETIKDHQHILKCRTHFLGKLNDLAVVKFNGELSCRIPHILNLRFHGMLADTILANLPQIATSTASACQGKGQEGSYVLRALGLSQADALSSIRFSFGRFTTINEVEIAGLAIRNLLKSNLFQLPNLG